MTAHLGLRLSPASGAKHRDLEVGRRALAWIAAVPNLVVACNTSPGPSVEALKSRGLGQHACNPDCLPDCRCQALYGTVPPIAYLSVVEPSCEGDELEFKKAYVGRLLLIKKSHTSTVGGTFHDISKILQRLLI